MRVSFEIIGVRERQELNKCTCVIFRAIFVTRSPRQSRHLVSNTLETLDNPVRRSRDNEYMRELLAAETAHLLVPFDSRGMHSRIANADEAASAVANAYYVRVDATARDEIKMNAARRERDAEHNLNTAG
jgi:hypothetical protein